MSGRTLDDALHWTSVGTGLCERALTALTDDAFAQPSMLPAWSRAHVATHLDRNAAALQNLVSWARTGVETPMYASTAQRDADIEAGATRPPARLRADAIRSGAELVETLAGLTDREWAVEVRTAQGRMVPASEIPWLRSREVMVHAVDLASVVTFDDLPADFLTALADDIVDRRRTTPDHPALVLDADGQRWEITGAGDPVVAAGTLAQVAAYLTGRNALGPELPAWL